MVRKAVNPRARMTQTTDQATSDFMREVLARGFVHQCTDMAALDTALAAGPVTGYIGFDCTADSLHVGSLVQIMLLRLFQRHGHKPIVLKGGGTTKVGDPSGKDESRRVLDDEEIARNMAGIRSVFDKFLEFGDGPGKAIMVDNDDWLAELRYVPFLRDIGRHFSVNRMLTFDSVRLRLEREQNLTFLEFNYMILQAYDFLELARRWNCTLQMGGSDQWGNIINGVDLTRRTDDRTVFGLTAPLITTASGAKMGKTAQGAIWLNADRLSPYDYYQYWRNTDDPDVGRFLRLFTELPLDEIARLESLDGAALNEAKKILAFEATRLCHGRDAAGEAAETARRTFEEGQVGDSLPRIDISPADFSGNPTIVDALVSAGLATSRSDARRTVEQGGCRINDETVIEAEVSVLPYWGEDGTPFKLSRGKKRHVLIRRG